MTSFEERATTWTTISGMRRLLYVNSALVLLIGIPLYLLSDHSDTYFAWTIHPPLTAAVLGAGYWASFVLELLSARERLWAIGIGTVASRRSRRLTVR